MYLKSLELHGFKSFPDRTVLKFNKGATVIVGPNGSGKSNITDAMRWVLGELSSKNIRGSRMEDVIFAGADDKKPMSFAEVSVTFDDSGEQKTLQSPYDEVTVTRRFYRSGDSEYFINRRKCRLKDIYELFMNTGIGREGYSIIGQGKIAEIVSKKSDERRGVFEESAGIAKYRYKKTDSEKKLAETEANMERVGDIERELSSRIGPLEKDSAKARQYLELYGEKKKTDISLWLYETERLKAEIAKAEDAYALSAHELEMAEDTLAATSAQTERLYDSSRDNKEASRRNRDEITRAGRELSEAESEIRLLTNERIHSEQTLSGEEKMLENSVNLLNRELAHADEVKKKTDEVKSEYSETDKAYRALNDEAEKQKLEIASYDRRLESLLRDKTSVSDELTDYKIRLNVSETSASTNAKRSSAIDAEISKYNDEMSAASKKADEAKKQINEYNDAVSGIEKEIADRLKTNSENGRVIGELEKRERTKLAESDSLSSRIAALERMYEHFDGYNNSVRFVMSEASAGRLSGIRGPLSHLIKTGENYITAIETTLGAALQNIVTDDEEAAKRSIEALKRGNAGRATFYPLTTIRAQERGREYEGLEYYRGFVGWGDELVSCDAEYRSVVKSLLARVAVFDNLDNATEAARKKGWKIRAVTLDGQQINAGGSFTGGQARRDSGMLSRSSQIDSLKRERDTVSAELAGIRGELSEARKAAEDVVRGINSLNDRASLIRSLAGAENKSFSDAEGRRRALAELIEGLNNDKAALLETSRDSAGNISALKAGIEEREKKISELTSERDAAASLRGECELELEEREKQLGEYRIRLAELSRDIEALNASCSEISLRAEEFSADAGRHKQNIEEARSAIASGSEKIEAEKQKAEELKKQIEALNEAQAKIDSTGDEIDTRIAGLRQLEKEQSSKKELVFIAHSNNERKLENLKNEDKKAGSEIWDEYELTYSTAKAFAAENDCHELAEGERASFLARQKELKTKIRSLGHVNVEAIDEYNEVKKRYEFISGQLNDLRASKEALTKILDGIEGEMKRMFLEAFGKINIYFGEVFRELFGGGHAEVILSDPENPLESGIEINAAPPGKTIKNLGLLSGGEQAFIAIALLFALIKVNPSPFCIFDEIEAALDEVNVARVGRYIRKYTDEMQIIMISHRRGTMDIADTLYGVTMPQNGVSKVYTLDGSSNESMKESLT